MLADFDAGATVATADLSRARRFYEDVLGLKVVEEMDEGGVVLGSGSTKMLLYVSQYAGTNEATAVTWDVGGEIDAIVRELAGKGVTFEHYDALPDTRREGDFHIAGPMRLAWLKDPDGNILALGGR